jgi:hypothetical protein
MKPFGKWLVFGGVASLLAGSAAAQAPPGPITPPPGTEIEGPRTPPPPRMAPRKNILGAWRLNRDESDDPKARANQRKVNDQNSNHSGIGRPQIGFPGGGIGGPGSGTGQHPNNGSQKTTTEDNERYQELIDPSVRLRLERKGEADPDVTMFGDQGRKTIFYTDGKKPDAPAGVGVDVAEARWDGTKLVSDAQLPKKGSMRRTYELSPDGLQLYEEVELVTGKDKNPATFRYVYDAVAAEDY